MKIIFAVILALCLAHVYGDQPRARRHIGLDGGVGVKAGLKDAAIAHGAGLDVSGRGSGSGRRSGSGRSRSASGSAAVNGHAGNNHLDVDANLDANVNGGSRRGNSNRLNLSAQRRVNGHANDLHKNSEHGKAGLDVNVDAGRSDSSLRSSSRRNKDEQKEGRGRLGLGLNLGLGRNGEKSASSQGARLGLGLGHSQEGSGRSGLRLGLNAKKEGGYEEHSKESNGRAGFRLGLGSRRGSGYEEHSEESNGRAGLRLGLNAKKEGGYEVHSKESNGRAGFRLGLGLGAKKGSGYEEHSKESNGRAGFRLGLGLGAKKGSGYEEHSKESNGRAGFRLGLGSRRGSGSEEDDRKSGLRLGLSSSSEKYNQEGRSSLSTNVSGRGSGSARLGLSLGSSSQGSSGLNLEVGSKPGLDMIQNVARQSSSLLTDLRKKASEAGEEISQSITTRTNRLRQRLSNRRAGSSGIGLKLGGLSVSANMNGGLLGQVKQGVEERVNSGRSLRTRLANRAGNAIQGGISATLNAAHGLTDIAERGLNLRASLTDGLISRVQAGGERARGLINNAREMAKSAMDTAVNVGAKVGGRVLEGASNLSNLSASLVTSGLNATRDMATRAGDAVSGLVNNAITSAASSTSILRNPLSAIGAARDLFGKVSGEAAFSVNSPLGSFSLKYGSDDN